MEKEQEPDSGKPVELRSEELHEVLGSVPPWILRRGITLVALIAVILLVGSWFFKYPETLPATMVLTGKTPPAAIVAKTGGRLVKLYVSDKQRINSGDYLAVIENPANTEDVFLLKKYLKELLENPEKILSLPKKEFNLGGIQSTFSALSRSIDNYRKFAALNYYPQKMASIKARIGDYGKQYENLERQSKIIREQHELKAIRYGKDTLLFEGKYLSPTEIDNAKTTYLQSRLTVENSLSALDNMKIQIRQLEENLLDTEQQYNDQQSSFNLEITGYAIQMTNEINTWEMTYVLAAPVSGTVTFNSYWSENQNVSAGETVFSIVPDDGGEPVGKALLPVPRSGKVKVGQRVNIKFAGYPENEFGTVRGEIGSISLVPSENNYTLEIILPNGLVTTYRKELPFSQEMQAAADIVTDDLRLLERLFMPVRKIFAESMD
ncbi:MAG: HlyD family efflux transporter periplasmic adaptor subunit [Prevotellaceae bacterium]|jgi:HlyD family secretion protein|nr:HlyD family efflux transporter periplasmic adaptor subunit [Prevotellaceae bacterium]